MKYIFTLLFTPIFFAFTQTWQPLPMYGGGFITDVVLHPTNPSVVAGVCDVGGVFISTDDCQTWTSHTANVPKTDFRNFYVRSFAFNPTTPTTQYFVSGDAPYNSTGKIWKTTNNASSWTSTNLPINIGGNSSARYAGATILINPLATNTLYVAGQPTFNYGTNTFNANSGLISSTDGGATWSKIGGSALDQTWITKLKFAPNDPSLIFISAIQTSVNGVSTTGTGLWQYNATTGTLTQLTTDAVLDFDFDAVNSNIIITTSSTANKVSTDGGATWSNLSTPTGLTYGLFASAHPTQTGVWYFGTYSFSQNTIVTTSDAGANWQQVKYSSSHNANKVVYPSYMKNNYQPSFGNYMACLVIQSGKAYLSDWYGVWRTADAGSSLANTGAAITENSNWTWTFHAQGIHNMAQLRTSVHPTDANRFYANVADIHGYQSTDGGTTMQYSRQNNSMNMTTRVDFHKNDPSVGYKTGSEGHGDWGRIFKTTDGGNSWLEVAASTFNGGAKNITDLQLTASVGTVIVGIVRNSLPSQVYRSDDGGETWTAWDNGLTITAFKTWERVDHLVRDADGETFYIWRDNKLFRRKLTDAAWVQLTLPISANWIADVKTHRTVGGTLFLSQYTTNLYKSTDFGTTWMPITTPVNVGSFAISPNAGNMIFQSWDASNAQILYQSQNGGATWSTLSTTGFWGMMSAFTFLNDTKLIAWSVGNSGFSTSLAAAVLPIEIIDFKGQTTEEGNFLTWQLGDKQYVQSIEIRKSNNGHDFTPLSILTKNETDFLDKNPFQKNYYQLKINDLDGKTSLSKIISIERKAPFGGLGAIKIYPSVTSGFLTIENAKSFEIINSVGQVVLRETRSSGNFQSFPNLTQLPNGIYFIKGVGTEGGIFTQKIMKQ